MSCLTSCCASSDTRKESDDKAKPKAGAKSKNATAKSKAFGSKATASKGGDAAKAGGQATGGSPTRTASPSPLKTGAAGAGDLANKNNGGGVGGGPVDSKKTVLGEGDDPNAAPGDQKLESGEVAYNARLMEQIQGNLGPEAKDAQGTNPTLFTSIPHPKTECEIPIIEDEEG